MNKLKQCSLLASKYGFSFNYNSDTGMSYLVLNERQRLEFNNLDEVTEYINDLVNE